MFSQSDVSLSRDRNLNFKLSEQNYEPRLDCTLDNQKKKETASRGVKFSSSVQTKEKEVRSREYDNYINTFTSSSSSSSSRSSNKNETKRQPGPFRPAKVAGNGGSSVAAMKKTSSVESPGRKILRTPTQEIKRLNTQQFSLF